MELRMLTLLPDRLAKHWDEILPMIVEALPPTASEQDELLRNTKLLENVLNGRLAVHTFVRVEEENGQKKHTLLAVVTTTTSTNLDSDKKNLILYTIFGTGKSKLDEWKEAKVLFSKYARGQGCSVITGYSNVEMIIKMAKLLGGEAEYTYIKIPLV